MGVEIILECGEWIKDRGHSEVGDLEWSFRFGLLIAASIYAGRDAHQITDPASTV